MHEPELYHKAHKEAKAVAGHIIGEYLSKVQWRYDGCDTLMDVGSGPGDVLMEYIYPLMPPSFHKIVCSDISEEMIEFTRTYYGNPNKFEYRVLDIESKIGVPNDLKGSIDHLTSTYVLHWVRDMEASVKNIYDLLRSDGGDCLIIFMPFITLFEAYDYMRNSTKWLDYKKDIDRYIPPIYYSKDPKDEFRSLMTKVGFSDISVDIKSELYNFESSKILKENLKSVSDGVVKNLTTPSLQSEFLDDLVAAVVKLAPMSNNVHGRGTNYSYCIRTDLMVASAKKT